MKILPRRMGHCRGRRLGLLVGLAMTLSATEARDMPTLNQERPSIVNVSNTVQCADGLLTVKARDIGITELLDEVASQCGLTMVWYVLLEQRLSVEFHRLPLAQGLGRILRTRSYVLLSTPRPPGKRMVTAAPPQTLWILPQADEKYAAPTMAKSTNRLLAEESILGQARGASALGDGNLEDRVQAAAALGKRGQTRAIAPLSLALTDRHAEVREAAVDSLAEIGGADAAHALAVALRDSDPHIREQAIEALGQVGGTIVSGLLQQALTDEAGFVRQAAIEIIEQLGSSAH